MEWSEFTISSVVGGKNAGCSFFITFNWCICSLFLTLVSDGRLQWPRLRNSRTLFCSRAMLICSIIWLGKRMLRVVVLRVLFFVDMRLPRYSVSLLICIVWSCFYVVDADQLSRYLRHNWLFDVVWWPPRTLWYVEDNHYHFTGPFRWKKRYQKKHRRE